MARTAQGAAIVRPRHADAMGVLSNLEMFERAGVSTASFWHELGLERAAVSPGLAVPWDAYARFAERAIEAVGADRIDVAVRELSRQFRGHWQPMSSSREALRFLVAELVPRLWPCIEITLVEAEPPLVALRVEIPEPLHAFRSYHRMNAHGIAGFTLGFDLPELRLLDVAIDDGARRGVYLLDLPDESLGAEELAPTTVTHAEGLAVLGNTEMLERAGVSTAEFWASQSIDATQLAPGRPVRWDAYAALLEEAAARVGMDRLASVARELPRQSQPHWPRWPTSRAALDAVLRELTPNVWPCLRAHVLGLPPPFFAVRLEVPPPLRPSRAYLELSFVALAGVATAVDRPEATSLSCRIDPTGRVGLLTYRLADETVSATERGIGEAARPQVQAHSPKHRSIRDALRVEASEHAPTVSSSLDVRFLELAPPFCAIEVRIPATLPPSSSVLRAHGLAFAASPATVGLPEATWIGTMIDEDDRCGLSVFVLDDERVEVPLGELGNKVRGNYCLAFVDICDMAGVDVRGWMTRHDVDRDRLIAGDLIEWHIVRELFELAEPEVGGPALRQASQHFADLTRPSSQHTLPLDPYAVLEFVHSAQLVTEGWGVLAPASVQHLGARHALIHVPLRKDAQGSSGVFRAHLYSLESVTRHLDLPPLRVVASRIDEREGIYVVELPVASHPGVEDARPDGPSTSELATKVVEGVYRERVEARASMVERLGREVARRTDVHSIAEVLTRDLREHLAANGVEIRLFVGGEDTPLRMHGAREGSLLTRAMAYGSQSIGTVRVWCDPPSTGPILAVLDVMMPWVGVAFGTAIDRADASTALTSTRAERDALRNALASVLATHPYAVFVLDARGHVEPANTHATSRLAREGTALLERIAEAVGTGSAAFEVHAVRHGDLVDRLVVIERARGAPALEDRVQSAVARLGLTERQADVVVRMSRGLSNKEIASELACSEVTVEKHLTAAFRRAGVTGRTQLAAKLWESA